MNPSPGAFQRAYAGRFWSVMSWDQLTSFWQRIDPGAGWYLYAIGEPPPTAPADAATTTAFMRGLDALLRDDHRESYCGIVYADDLEAPGFVKIYDPNHLGSSCSAPGHQAPLPGWIMCRVAPEDLRPARPPAENRKRWWKALLGG